jgi:hypothetical protein
MVIQNFSGKPDKIICEMDIMLTKNFNELICINYTSKVGHELSMFK